MTQKRGCSLITDIFYCDEYKINKYRECWELSQLLHLYATFGSLGLQSTLKKPQIHQCQFNSCVRKQ